MQKRGKRLVLLMSLSSLFFLVLFLILPLASANNITTPATIIPAPLGSIQITDNKITTFVIIDDTQFLIDLETGQIIHSKKLSPSGVVLTEDGVEGAGVPYDGYDEDAELYVGEDSYDPNTANSLSTSFAYQYIKEAPKAVGGVVVGFVKQPFRIILGTGRTVGFEIREWATNPKGEALNLAMGIGTVVSSTTMYGEQSREVIKDVFWKPLKKSYQEDPYGFIGGRAFDVFLILVSYAKAKPVTVPAQTTALVKYDPVFAMDQIASSGEPGTVILYHHTTLEGYVGITKDNIIWGSPKAIAADAKPINKGFVYLSDIQKVQTEFDLHSLFAYPIGKSKVVLSKTLGDFSHTIKLRVPSHLVERLDPPILPDAIILAPHIYRIPCAIGPGKGACIKPIFGGEYYEVTGAIPPGSFRTPRLPPMTLQGGEWWNFIYDDKYP